MADPFDQASDVEPDSNGEQTGTAEPGTETNQPPASQPTEQQVQLTPELIQKLLQDDSVKQAILQSDDVRRTLQSMKDKEVAREKRKLLDEQRRREQEERRRAEEEELNALLAQGNIEEAGKRLLAKRQEEEGFLQAAQQVGLAFEQALIQHPEFQALGEDVIENVYQQVAENNGTVVDLAAELMKARVQKEANALLDQKKTEILEELKAQLVEQGALKRSEQAEQGNVPSAGVSGATGGSQGLTFDDALDAYSNGDISYDDLVRRYPQAKSFFK